MVTDFQGSAAAPTAATTASISAAQFRHVLGHFATGVTVVTTTGPSGPAGLAVNSFTSVSLDPPLVAFCVSRESSTWRHIRVSGSFCVNILAEEQEDVCRLFATKGADRFRGIDWHAAPSGAPVIGAALAWIDCAVEAEHEAGDHLIVVARVQELAVAYDGRPLLFYRGRYVRILASTDDPRTAEPRPEPVGAGDIQGPDGVGCEPQFDEGEAQPPSPGQRLGLPPAHSSSTGEGLERRERGSARQTAAPS